VIDVQKQPRYHFRSESRFGRLCSANKGIHFVWGANDEFRGSDKVGGAPFASVRL
jgi:hypothetical protein